MKSIEFLKIVHLRGPNMWTYRPVMEAWVDIGELEDCPSNILPGFYGRLTAWLPSLVEHRCSYGERGGFLRRVQEGTWPAHIMEHVVLELQTLAGLPGGFGRAREMAARGHYKVVVRAWHEEVTRTALYAARDLVMAAIEDRPFDVAAVVEALTDLVDAKYLGPSTAAIVAAADDRHIPAIRLSEGNLVQLGYGAKSRRIWTAETDLTSAIAESISRDKDLTKSLLAPCGVPAPEGRMADDPADAWEAAQEIGLPVVVKPYDGNHGRGVFINLTTREEIETAYGVAEEEGSGVMVERSIAGSEHRLLVIGGKLAAATRGDVVAVVGDGCSTIAALIDSQINSDPRRGATEEHPLSAIRLDAAARMEIARQGFKPDAVPPAGHKVLIQRAGNHAFDVTDAVHPEVARAACLAAKIVGLDIAGIDLVCADISRPLQEQGGAIVEVNAGPSLLMHLKPAVGRPRPVGKAIVDHLFPGTDSCCVPVVGVTGSHSTTLVARIVARLAQLAGRRTGLACGDGLFVDQRTVDRGDCARFAPARRLLMNRAVDAVVIENPPASMAGEGLAYERCQVGVITAIDPAALLPEHGIENAEQLFKVLRTQVDVVLPAGAAILNADDPTVLEMAGLCDGEVIFFGAAAAAPPVVEHRRKGGRALLVRDDKLVLAAAALEAP
ncbi:MAG: cyanophycin synthetase, partial [Sulfuritalea sp.]|nr:cyanophycin synthetase [Sulfuritalea sp.]